MTSLTLQLESNENEFRYDFTNAFYEREYEIVVTKIHGHAKINYAFEYIEYDKKDDDITPEWFEISNNSEDFQDLIQSITSELKWGSIVLQYSSNFSKKLNFCQLTAK